ncbi:DUF411 domain-containing protein [Marinicella gelatinilytica]|uniref:DUF411 domain-containing protein n=1 Tax=Marinicella gelatinilytica TaxID=2996017 RepID=UPI002260CBA1|nr:DUF411 domain-containing protein [Marinicella gelatinilytica]MCX7543865.1 DUF411 domain-containing protein [Marinicella gelatinilytica]
MKTLKNTLSVVLATLIFLMLPTMSVHASKTDTADHALTVYKSATCGCCVKWIDHANDNGLSAKGINTVQLNKLKDQHQVPANYRSCHTAISRDGYVFEGHIPAKFVQKFLQEKPDNYIGLVVPGMPVGSPGMEYQNKFSPYVIMAFDKNGSLTPYAEINSFEAQFE